MLVPFLILFLIFLVVFGLFLAMKFLASLSYNCSYFHRCWSSDCPSVLPQKVGQEVASFKSFEAAETSCVLITVRKERCTYSISCCGWHTREYIILHENIRLAHVKVTVYVDLLLSSLTHGSGLLGLL